MPRKKIISATQQLKSPKIPRFVIEVNKEFHHEIAGRAELRGTTIRQWILQAIAEKIAYEDQYK